jgi:carboxymethylenebutenolidase
MIEQARDIRTKHGIVDSFLYRPDGAGPFPAVLFYMDGVGIRQPLRDMASRLAQAGYVVLLPNLYFTHGRAETIKLDLSDRERLIALATSVKPAWVASLTSSFLDELTNEPGVKPKVGAVGYCMGGGFALTAAGRYPDRVAAAASLHGGRLATDQTDSPHLLAPNIRGQVYVGVAEIDPFLAPGETERLDQALKAANVRYQLETYPQVQHGFCVPDLPSYDPIAAERHWTRLLDLFRATL